MGRHHEHAAVRWHQAALRRAALAALAVGAVAAALHCSPFDSADDGGGDGGATGAGTGDPTPDGTPKRPAPGGTYTIYVSTETGNGVWAGNYACLSPDGGAPGLSGRFVPLLRTDDRPTLDFFIDETSSYKLVDGAPLGSGGQIGGAGPGTAPKLGPGGEDMSGSDSGGVWTGFGPKGERAADCEGWTSGTVGTGQTGRFLSTGTQWLAAGPAACDQKRHVYCVQIE